MKEFLISEKYRLEIHWEKVIYENDNMSKLVGCYLSGPVLREVQQLQENDYIDLDFGNQYTILISHYFILRLSWVGVTHTSDKIFLNDAIVKNIKLNDVPKLGNSDYIVVDTSDHEDGKHHIVLTYRSYLVNELGEIYSF